jgi:deoxyribodipyrimidine photolyase-related protein
MIFLYILPNQIYNIKCFEKLSFDRIIMWEHPMFFKHYKFNKKKLILHRASMKQLFDTLENKGYNVKYIEFHEKHKVENNSILYDPINEMKDFKSSLLIEPPNFLVPKSYLHEIYEGKKSKKSMSFTNYFYPRVKSYIKVLENTQSLDKENREGDISNAVKDEITPLPVFHDNKYTKKAIDYVEKHFPKNHGNVDNFFFPTTEKDAKKMLHHFVENSLMNFGQYQDAILDNESIIFHSCLSSSLNIGLITPSLVIDEVMKKKNSGIRMNNIEGFIRQLIWREFQRYCYIYLKTDLKKQNHFKLDTKLSKKWYNGSLGVYPVDKTIIKAFDKAYLHHIERLMIMGNFMLLSEIRKEDGFKWFMEFAIDSYEWVMYQNVYDMVFYSTGGKTSYKPYISSSKYISKMSDYTNINNWTIKWDNIYRSFREKTKLTR